MDDSTPAAASDLNRTRCPGCAGELCALPRQATFCPSCGRRLRPARTAWAAACRLAGHLWRDRDEPSVDCTGPRAPIVVGYGKALWRLGWRYEHGRGITRNVPEAMRCYRKSAGLGNVEAEARVQAAARVIPLPGEAVEESNPV